MQQQFRAWFEQWGRPAEVRVDNGIPWGGWYDIPTVFALWLIGLGVPLHWNAPRQPQENGVIEQSHGSAQRWVDLATCASVAVAQAALHESDLVQREHMAYAGKQSRLEVFPELAFSGRVYSRVWEEQTWELSRVQDELERYCPRRRVERQGHITFFYRRLYVGERFAGTDVLLTYDRTTNMWTIQQLDGQGIKAVAAVEVQREAIMNLSMCDAAKAKCGRRPKGR